METLGRKIYEQQNYEKQYSKLYRQMNILQEKRNPSPDDFVKIAEINIAFEKTGNEMAKLHQEIRTEILKIIKV